MGEAAQPRLRRGVLCKSCRKGRPSEQRGWDSVGQRRKLRTVSYSFSGTERSWVNQDENKNPGGLMRLKMLTFKSALKG